MTAFRIPVPHNSAGRLTSFDRYKDLDGGSSHLVVETDFTYDGIGRLTDLTHTHDTTTIADYGWTYDAFSRVTQLSFSSLVGNDGTSDYAYDNTGQLTGVDHDFQTDESYSYDENGNRTNTGYTTGTNNRLTSDGTFNRFGQRRANACHRMVCRRSPGSRCMRGIGKLGTPYGAGPGDGNRQSRRRRANPCHRMVCRRSPVARFAMHGRHRRAWHTLRRWAG